MAASQEFWIVAAGNASDSQDAKMKSSFGASKFAIDDKKAMNSGSFDNLVTLTDDLAKADNQLDSIVHRIERQYTEVDPAGQFVVKGQGRELAFDDYIKDWQWDETKYPKDRLLIDNMKFLTSTVTKLDEEVRTKMAQFNDYRTQKGNIAKKDATTSLPTRDLVDLVIPSAENNERFVYTEHLTTVCVILSRAAEPDFLKSYESFGEHVIPMSALKFTGMDDKDGNSLWRVVMMKSQVDGFKKACREHRFVPRDFEYSAEGYKKLLLQRSELEEQTSQALARSKDICRAAWGDAMSAWIHIKAMRIFVESVLRFGQGTPFSAFVFSPKNPVKARVTLTDIFSTDVLAAKAMTDAAAEDGEEYFPYVSVSFFPMAAGMQK
jgi:V-type H+-transporting ATPase subunit C